MPLMHILFDIDGTVVDHKNRIYGLYEEYGRASGLPILDGTAYFERKSQGEDDRVIAGKTFPPSVVDDYLAWKRTQIESGRALARDVLVSGMKETLEALAASHSLVALSARQSNDVLVDELRRLDVWRFFRTSLTVSPGAPVEGKTAALVSYLEDTPIAPEKVALVGDTEVEVAAAARAGVQCISVAWGLRNRSFLLRHGAHRIVGSARELREVLELADRLPL